MTDFPAFIKVDAKLRYVSPYAHPAEVTVQKITAHKVAVWNPDEGRSMLVKPTSLHPLDAPLYQPPPTHAHGGENGSLVSKPQPVTNPDPLLTSPSKTAEDILRETGHVQREDGTFALPAPQAADPLAVSGLPQNETTRILNHREKRIGELKQALDTALEQLKQRTIQLDRQRTRTEAFRRAGRFYHCILRVATQINDDLYTRVGELERQLTEKQKQIDALEARIAEKERLEQSLDLMQAQLNRIETGGYQAVTP